MERALILYDGLCGFCHGAIRWLMKHDRRDVFRFVPQQSELAATVLGRHGIARDQMIGGNSVYLALDWDTEREQVLMRSDVTVTALVMLGGLWSLLGHVLRLIPKTIRDDAYSVIASNRFRIAGRYNTCPMPSERERAKFLG